MTPELKYFKYVLWLSWFTIVYNILEGVISVWIGAEDETLTLLGFGIDSFIEMISGLGILIMVMRIRKNPGAPRSTFEVSALRITGWGFYILAAGLVAGAAINLYKGNKPETTLWGVIISLISIAVMLWLYFSKIRLGRKLNSEPVIADGRCTLICIYMSVVLLLSSAIYAATGLGWIDSLGALGLAWFSFTEGREALEKAKGKADCCC
jgi:divalent metal cation (Fe/Co/Zn/Cd) transporter